jgi:hypothetical protein
MTKRDKASGSYPNRVDVVVFGFSGVFATEPVWNCYQVVHSYADQLSLRCLGLVF